MPPQRHRGAEIFVLGALSVSLCLCGSRQRAVTADPALDLKSASALFPALNLAMAVQELLATGGAAAARARVAAAIAVLRQAEAAGAALTETQGHLLRASTRALAAAPADWRLVDGALTEVLEAIAAEGRPGGRPGLRPLSPDDPRVKAWHRACGEET